MQYMNTAAASTASSMASLPAQLTAKATIVSPNAGITNLYVATGSEAVATFPSLPTENSVECLDPETIAKKLRER